MCLRTTEARDDGDLPLGTQSLTGGLALTTRSCSSSLMSNITSLPPEILHEIIELACFLDRPSSLPLRLALVARSWRGKAQAIL